MGITERVADIIANTSFESLPPEAVATVKRVALDGVGVMVAGSQEGPAVWNLMEYAKEIGGEPVSSVVAGGIKTSAPMAAFVNGASCHVLDYEVMWNTHPTSPCLPAILALAEWKGFSGKEIITAFALGLEVQGRVRLAGTAGQFPYYFRVGIHLPGLVGPLGSAAACSRLLGLDSAKTRMALGMAASRVGTLFGNVGSDTKCQHCGHSGRMGLESALLAQQGATANPDIIEAYQGYAETFYPVEQEGGGPVPPTVVTGAPKRINFDLDAVAERFANPYRFIEDPPNIKRLPANTNMQTPMEAALELRQKYDIDPAQIAEVTIEGPVSRYVDRPAPKTGLEGKFSYQYATSVALVDGKVTIDSFHSDRFNRPDVQEMIKKVRVVDVPKPSPGAQESGMAFGGRLWKKVTVRMKDGSEHAVRVEMPPGFVGGRELTREEHLAKMRDCFTRVISPEKAEWCIGLLENLENASSADIAELMDTLR